MSWKITTFFGTLPLSALIFLLLVIKISRFLLLWLGCFSAARCLSFNVLSDRFLSTEGNFLTILVLAKKNGSQIQKKGKIIKAFDMLIFKVIISQGRGIALFDIFIEYLISLPSPGAHSIWTSSEVGTVYEHTVVLMMKRMRMRMDENGVHYRRPRRRSRDVKRRQGVGLKVVGEAIWDSH